MTASRTSGLRKSSCAVSFHGKARAVVAVVDVALVAGGLVEALERDRRVGVVPVVVLEHDPDPRVVGQVGTGVGVGGVGRLRERQEPVRVLDDPARVDAHVVRDHVAGEPDPARPRPVAQRGVGRFAADVVGDPVVVERVRRGDRVGVAAPALDLLGGARALPEADQPQPGHAPASEPVQLLVGDRVERADVAAIRARQLVEPDVRALRHEHDPRHPGGVAAEALGFVLGARERRRVGRAGADAPAHLAELERPLLFGQDPERQVDLAHQPLECVAEQAAPTLPDVAQLAGQRARGVARRRAKELEQRLALGPERRAVRQRRLERRNRLLVGRGRRERTVVEQVADRHRGRVLVGDPRQEQLLDDLGRRLGLAVGRELGREAAQDLARVGPETRFEVVGGPLERPLCGLLLVALHEQVEDLVEEAHRHDLAGLGGRTARLAGLVHAGGQAPHPGPVEDLQVAVLGGGRAIHAEPAARRPGQGEAGRLGHGSRSWAMPRSGIATQSGRLFSS